MTDYYWVDLYINYEEQNLYDLISNTVDALVNNGCKFKALEYSRSDDPGMAFDEQNFSADKKVIDMQVAIEHTADDLKSWFDGPGSSKVIPGTKLIFECELKTDGTDPGSEEIDVSFWRGEDLLFFNIVIISLHVPMEVVLDGSDPEHYKHNKSMIVGMVRNLYERTGPFFGWMDYEEHSSDRSYPQYTGGKFPDANDYVIVGKELSGRLEKQILKYDDNKWEKLFDGGYLIKGLNNKDDF